MYPPPPEPEKRIGPRQGGHEYPVPPMTEGPSPVPAPPLDSSLGPPPPPAGGYGPPPPQAGGYGPPPTGDFMPAAPPPPPGHFVPAVPPPPPPPGFSPYGAGWAILPSALGPLRTLMRIGGVFGLIGGLLAGIFTMVAGTQWFIEDAPADMRPLATVIYYVYLALPLTYGFFSLWLARRLGVPGRPRTYWGTVAFNITAMLILAFFMVTGSDGGMLIPLVFHSVMTVLILLPSSRAFHAG